MITSFLSSKQFFNQFDKKKPETKYFNQSAIHKLITHSDINLIYNLRVMSLGKKRTPQMSTLNATERLRLIDEDVKSPMSQTVDIDVQKQLKDKFRTFTNWNYREIAQKIKKSAKNSLPNEKTPNDNSDLVKALLSFVTKPKTQQKAKKIPVVQQLSGVKAERRQRFKKSENPLHFIKHYMERQNFKPSQEEMYLIDRTIDLKKYVESTSSNMDVEKILKKIYHLMNLAVDCNQLNFLILLILLAADICYQVKDQNRAFYFYNEARVAATYANISQIKTQSLMGLGLVVMNLELYDEAIVILKKNLQYAWQSKNIQAELMIYDFLGQCYYHQGKMKQAQYYHTRYVQNEAEKNDSAIKKISNEMLNDYNRQINSLQKNNLTSLFIEYLNLPITNFQKVPVPDALKKNYANYKDGESPRKKRSQKRFAFHDFPHVNHQIEHLLKEDYEFITEIPNPDMHRNFIAAQKFGRKRKSQEFEQSSQFHRIIGTKPPKLNFEDIYKYPLEKRIQRAVSQKKNDNWWEVMLNNTKKQRTQKVGILREKVRISHQSYHKYPEQRKRAQSLKSQKIKESFNKTLLNWIDPIK